ncbi:hypothetical protein [Hymenobacter rubidus]|uniref:hypothetical protein n=1 Tax=Hymenobacter rubidus TaxID=1441626 RepID=UPI00191FFC99|nr:hypothetical protein [Hymenobacter rubidus]
MKYLILLFLSLLIHAASAQNYVYLADGTRMPGSVSEITAEKVKFKNLEEPESPTYAKSIEDVLFAFNAVGSYVLFSKVADLPKKEKDDFMNAFMKPKVFDVVVDIKGIASSATITDETDNDITYTVKGKSIQVPKTSLSLIIRRDGTHQIFISSKQLLPILVANHDGINKVFIGTSSASNTTAVTNDTKGKSERGKAAKLAKASQGEVAAVIAPAPAPAPKIIETPGEMAVDKKEMEKQAVEKTTEFTDYLKAITAVNADNESAKKAISLACDLFSDENARVEVSNIAIQKTTKYKIRDYLTKLMLRSGQFDKVQVEYANINYVSKFVKGTDGNYHGTVSYVQTFKGLMDEKIFYGDITKRTIEIIAKPYKKAINGETIIAWQVFLGDVGVVETKKVN